MNLSCEVFQTNDPHDSEFVAIDVDGNLSTANHKIAHAPRASNAKMRASGFAVVVASTRGPTRLWQILSQPAPGEEWVVAFLGAFVARWMDRDMESLADRRIGMEFAGEVENVAFDMGVTVNQFVGDRWIATKESLESVDAGAITGEAPIAVSKGHLDNGPGPHKMSAISRDSIRRADLHTLAEMLPATAIGIFSLDNHLEITSLDADRAAGLRILTGHRGVDPLAGDAVGDGVDDIGMFKVVDAAVAVRHKPDEVKAAARHVTKTQANECLASALEPLAAKRSRVLRIECIHSKFISARR